MTDMFEDLDALERQAWDDADRTCADCGHTWLYHEIDDECLYCECACFMEDDK